jgi:subtilase family serine protease
VGGTDFSDTYSGTNSTYWNSTNTAIYESAKSYVPEIPLNGSCGSQLFATYYGYTTTYGSSGFCNGKTGRAHYLDNAAGGGGPSGSAVGVPSISGVVSGTCQGYAKPSWQSGVLGNPSDGVRDIPDVSLFASDGWWNHYYVFCWSDPAETSQGSAPCTGPPSGWSAAGGTSFATPIMAGIQALVNQQAGGPQGNPNYQLYQLAGQEYGATGSSTCNSSLGNAVDSACIFHDVTLGDIDADCQGSYNCYRPSGTYGVLSTSNSSYAPAYEATTGWDFATGIGTVNVYNLVTNWSSTAPAPTLQVAPAINIATAGLLGGPFSPSSFTYTVSATIGSVDYAISGVPNWLTPSATSGTVSAGTPVTFTLTVNTGANSLAANTYTATITFTDTDTGQTDQTLTATLTANKLPLQVTPASNIAASGTQGGPFSPSSFSYTLSAASGSVKYSISGVPNWLTASPTSGTATTKATSVTFKINTSAADKLSASTYVSSINFNNNTNNQVTTRVATLTVTPKEYTIEVSASPSAECARKAGKE